MPGTYEALHTSRSQVAQGRPLRRDLNEVKDYLSDDQERSVPSYGEWEQSGMSKNFEKASVVNKIRKIREDGGERTGHRSHSMNGPCKGLGFTA